MKNCKKIKILGIGDYGISVIEEISKNHTENIEYLNLNTDYAYFYKYKNPSQKLGPKTTIGLGSGSDFFIGKKAAEESMKDIQKNIKDAGLIIIVAGLGGGTGSGASPVVASIAKELKIPVFAFVTIPFDFENKFRCKNSEESIKELKGVVDLLTTISLDKTKVFLSENLLNEKIDAKNLFYNLNTLMISSVLNVIELSKVKSINEILKLYKNK